MSYPEHEKMAALRDKIDVVTDFLEWCGQNGQHVVTIDREASRYHVVVDDILGIEELLAAYFLIDRRELEREKRAMLAEIRSQH